ncbi:hypothetical protein Plhal304r1_c029g0095721 [Plasmopara halstedii]
MKSIHITQTQWKKEKQILIWMLDLTYTPAISTMSTTMSTVSTCTIQNDTNQDNNIYVRAWRYVQRRLHLRPRANSCPTDMNMQTVNDSLLTRTCNSYSCNWQHVSMLKEVEQVGARAQWRAQPEGIKETEEWIFPDTLKFKTQAQRKTAQLTCHNCGLLFFSSMSIAQDTSAFCGRDCQSTFEYRRNLQNVVDESENFRSNRR